MGRSKFPGKPSKSINRKRISVLQLEDESAAAAPASSSPTPAHDQQAVESGAPGVVHPESVVEPATDSAATNNKGGHCADEDDEERRRRGGGGGDGRNGRGGAGGSGSSSSGSGGGGNGSSHSSSGGTQNNRKVNGAGTGGSGGSRGSGSSRATAQPVDVNADNGDVSNPKTKKKDVQEVAAAAAQDAVPSTDSNSNRCAAEEADDQATAACCSEDMDDEENDDDEVEEDEEDDDGEDTAVDEDEQPRDAEDKRNKDDSNDNNVNASSSAIKKSSSTTTTTRNTSTAAMAAKVSKLKKQKKFKNLNLLKPEVMLPSSTKQKQQQPVSSAAPAKCPSPSFPPIPVSVSVTEISSASSSNSINASNNNNNNSNNNKNNNKSGSTTSINPFASTSAVAVNETKRVVVPEPENNDTDANMNNDPVVVGDGGIGVCGGNADGNDTLNNCSSDTTNTLASTSTATAPTTASAAKPQKKSDTSTLKPSDNAHTASNGPNTVKMSDSFGDTKLFAAKYNNPPSGSSSPASSTSANAPSNASATAAAPAGASPASSTASSNAKQKKTVTFKNILETSDDKSAVKKKYQPDKCAPLVSIMKKECLNRPLMYSRSSECIVRPSRLTEILKNNSNIDKLNSLQFRSSKSTSAVFGGNLFGVPQGGDQNDDDESHPFHRLHKKDSDSVSGTSWSSGLDEEEDDDDEDDDDEDEEDDDEEDDDEPEDAEEADELPSGKEVTTKANETVVKEASSAPANNNIEDDNDDSNQQMIVDKHFVLPKRSTRSSRVIKPNKRLLEDGIICRKTTPKVKSAPATSSTTNSANVPSAAAVNAAPTAQPKKEPHNYFGLGNLDDDKSPLSLAGLTNKEASESSSQPRPSGFLMSTSAFSNFGSSLKANSFVLRQPRLQFDSSGDRGISTSLAASLPKSLSMPKSNNLGTSSFFLGSSKSANMLNTNASLSGCVNCSVCGTPINSKNLPQARKYGTPGCAVCCKFISKITKNISTPTIKSIQYQCKNGDGNCAIQAYPKGHVKYFKKIYKDRCTTCWLKKCLQVFQLPVGQRLRLSSALPASLLKHLDTKEPSSAGADLLLSEKKQTTDLLSPSSSATTSGGLFSSAHFKWKPSGLDASGVDSIKLNLKSNPLAENNVTFGSTPLLRPALLEKPLFLKSPVDTASPEQNAAATTPPDTSATEKLNAAEAVPSAKASTVAAAPPTRTKRKEKPDKEDKKEKASAKSVDKAESKEDKNDKTAPISVGTAPAAAEAKVSASSKLLSPRIEAETEPVAGSATNEAAAATQQEAPSGSATAPAAATSEPVKRQRIDLKGPRVKHVCRSASIVLGQPLATFGDEEGDEPTGEDAESAATAASVDSKKPEKLNGDVVIDENDNCSSCKEHHHATEHTAEAVQATRSGKQKESEARTQAAPDKEMPKEKPTPATSKTTTTVIAPTTRSSAAAAAASTGVQKAAGGGGKKSSRQALQEVATNTASQGQLAQQQVLKRPRDVATAAAAAAAATQKPKPLISIDFWENYDPAEVCQTGFGLIITETVAQRALCFLCGSTGLNDTLIFCACCCEPYHQYCIMDEYNLKHSSLDDTLLMVSAMNSALDSSNSLVPHSANNLNGTASAVARLNWLCPRCTVCYTCNMSSGAKVKCQKCQKNYHSTCLGTSKRLLGADRPLICVNCLKCKSCGTTKVSKFVGNLPMCTGCFKLRKKGNFCPICQKCYDDNDFDLKMMECGDCKQWVHSRCEELTDEQYNLLSTLPESIEFICRKCARRNECSKQKAQEWRQAVIEEFKASLLSVLKLLSKSRQACALLRLSPRKMVRCCCGAAGQGQGQGKIQPKSLQFTSGAGADSLGSDGESQASSVDIYEFKDKQPDHDHNEAEASSLMSDPLKGKCICHTGGQTRAGPPQQGQHINLVDIKKKIAGNEYVSLAEFNYDMNNVIQSANCDELVIAYKEILSEQFPWFQNETKACTDALEEDMFESCTFGALNDALDSSGEDFRGGGGGDVNYMAGDQATGSNLLNLPPDVDDLIYALKSTRIDARSCLFCRKTGEGPANEESRLLYCGHDYWVHTNCAMWSAEVFEEIDGSLQNVHSAVSRGRMIKCRVCGNRGATVGCNVRSCGEHYHYPCARNLKCAFLTDKSVYCPAHSKDALKGKPAGVTIETNFEVCRPVYVELERKRKKLVEPARVQFHIGSLEVRQLGTVLPRFSDSYEAVVPINFLCSRLYWSSKEPWKIVEYTVRTTIQNTFTATLTPLDAGRNFTVDHSNPNASMVQLGLAQIARWHNCLARGGEFGDLEAADLASIRSKLMPPAEYSQNSSSGATDENTTEEEPQSNAADLFPPEIKDAIFEDLSHDLFDGITVLDIFPKCMVYDDMGNVDGRAEFFASEQSKDGVAALGTGSNSLPLAGPPSQVSDEDTATSSLSGRHLELAASWQTNGLNINHVEDALLSASRISQNMQLMRAFNSVAATSSPATKAELLKKAGHQSQALRPLCKLEPAASMKRRKLAKEGPAAAAAVGNTSAVFRSLTQQRTRKEACAVSVSRRQSQTGGVTATAEGKTFTWSAAKRYIEDGEKDPAGTLKVKLTQMDGVDDSITEYRIITTTGSMDMQQQQQQHQQQQQYNGASTVKCERCHCTYRTFDSFQRHLPSCEPMSSTSESESEAAPRSPDTSNMGGSPLTSAGTITMESLNDLHKFNGLGRPATLTANMATNAANATAFPLIQTAFPQTLGTIGNTINGIPIANLQGVQGLQSLQGLSQLQPLQGLQNIQLQSLQPQTLGGNFFISQANPNGGAATTTGLSDDMQFFSNPLQGFTLAPSSTTGYGTIAAQQPQQAQLIAVSTNPDGTQQFIQLPATTAQPQQAQFLPAGTLNAYQTLQPSGGDKKILLPVGGKPLKTVATKAVQQQASAGAKNKLKGGNGVKPIQSKMANGASLQQQQQQPPQQPQHQPQAQLLNANLLQQMQQAAAGMNTQQAPQLLFQTQGAATQQPSIIMQQLGGAPAAAQNIFSFVTTDPNTNQPQVQYVTLPAANDFKAPASSTPFLTNATGAANTLMQGATYLQTDASGNLMLTTTPAATAPATNGLQMLTATPLGGSQPPAQVIGTLIQPQTLQLGGGDGQQQQQVIIGNTSSATSSGLEMIAATAAPQVILATQPMYYGLETIVQNTVMSSQQFVSTAMPGVLSQNAHFSATTTQVFQASKIEPLVDLPAGYMVLNNVDASGNSTPTIVQSAPQQQQQQQTGQQQGQAGQQQNTFLNAASIMQQQQQQHQQHQIDLQQQQQQQQQPPPEPATIYRLQTVNDVQYASTPPPQPAPASSPYIETSSVQHQQRQQSPSVQVVTAKVPPVAKRTMKSAAPVTKVQPQVINKVMPTSQPMHQQAAPQKFTVKQQQPSPQGAYHSSNQQKTALYTTTTSANSSNTVTNQKITVVSAAALSPAQQLVYTATTTTTTSSSNGVQQFSTVTKPSMGSPVATTAVPSHSPGPRKTNLIRPINKAEVKPKMLKATLHQQQQQAHCKMTATSVASTSVNNVASKMVMLKPQQQQPQHMSQPQVYQQQNGYLIPATASSASTTTSVASASSISGKLVDCTVMQQQHHHQQQQQQQFQQTIQLQQPQGVSSKAGGEQYILVSDQNGLFLQAASPQATGSDRSTPQQQYSDSQPDNDYYAGQQQQQQQSELPATSSSTTTSNHRLQYSHSSGATFNTNVPTNIVNPLQHTVSITATSTASSQLNGGGGPAMVSRPTNRVLPMQQRQSSDHVSNVTTTTATVKMHATAMTKTSSTHSVMQQQQQQQQPQHHVNNQAQPLEQQAVQQAPLPVAQQQYNTQNNNNNNGSTVSNGIAHHPAKCYEVAGEMNLKMSFDMEVKKEQQPINVHGTMMHQMAEQQTTMNGAPAMGHLPSNEQQLNSFEKASEMMVDYAEEPYKCSSMETVVTYQQQQLEMPNGKVMEAYSANCLALGGDTEQQQLKHVVAGGYGELMDTQKMLAPPNGVAGEEDGEDDDGSGESDEAMDNDDEVDDDEDDDDEDDDGFSLKMPTDCDQDMSDGDEPAVKEKISKILDNLTNEECSSVSESVTTTATTVEASAATMAMVGMTTCDMAVVSDFMGEPMETDMDEPQHAYGCSAGSQVSAADSEYITQIAENIRDEALQQEQQQQQKQQEHMQQQQQHEQQQLQQRQDQHDQQEDRLQQQHLDAMSIKSLDLPPIPVHPLAEATPRMASPTGGKPPAPKVNESTTKLVEDAIAQSQGASTAKVATASQLVPPPHPSRDPKKITGPHLLYEIQSEDGFTYKSTSIVEVWEKVFESVQVARRAHGLAPLPDGPLADMSGVQMIGLKTNALRYLIEQLPGVEKCSKYTPKYHKRPPSVMSQASSSSSSLSMNSSPLTLCSGSSSSGMGGSKSASLMGISATGDLSNLCNTSSLDYSSDQDELVENPYESARCEPFTKRSEYDMFSWLASRHRKQPIQVFLQPSDTELVPRRGTGSNLPMAMKYRTLKETYKDYVGVFRSHIHGRGLYCTKDIEAGEMVIEYAGELIRSTLTDKRERYYDSRGIGCYMFKIDDNLVVDATMRGNAARFINHSCEPNCYSKVVDILGHKHIIIFALRRIVQGEELTYDYKFPFEDEKIPCSCGSKRCRKYLN